MTGNCMYPDHTPAGSLDRRSSGEQCVCHPAGRVKPLTFRLCRIISYACWPRASAREPCLPGTAEFGGLPGTLCHLTAVASVIE